mmetsp:Transcript_7993/g.23609  ORF Transcript_7993/g.23609 Transcript_7993/m.23609 type:complete len:240 (-) Transcript_7993:316-1035(-)
MMDAGWLAGLPALLPVMDSARSLAGLPLLLPRFPGEHAKRRNEQFVLGEAHAVGLDGGDGNIAAAIVVVVVRAAAAASVHGSDALPGRGNRPEPVAQRRQGIASQVLHELGDAVVPGVCHLHERREALGGVGHRDQVGRFVRQILEGVQGRQAFGRMLGAPDPPADGRQQVVDRRQLLPAGLVLGKVLEGIAGVLAALGVVRVRRKDHRRHQILHLEDQNLGVGLVSAELGQQLEGVVL